ncbi:MAG TPA: methyltransferase domain-containing protein, partial [Methanobacterium sp.]|nr:methyltransferase domain-containing protein [Methanobacterium sp.]
MNMLNKRASSHESRPAEVLKSLDIHDGDIIGDIGTGGGYFTFEFSKKVGKKGRVYSIDTNQKSLDFVNNNSNEVNNIKTILANENGFLLPEKVDIFFLRNVFHHLPEPVQYFRSLRQYLKEDGKIALIEYKKKGFSFVGLFGHYTPEETIIGIMEKAGFCISEKFDFLDTQSFMIFKIK